MAATRRFSKLKIIGLRAAISFTTIVVTLLVIELIVRAVPLYPADFYEFDPNVGEVLRPGAVGVYLNPMCWSEVRQQITINSKGLRDVEHTYARDERTRILILGDSFVEGFQVPLEATFHMKLERLLGVEAIAGAHGGWGTDNELLWYRHEGYKYQADLVLLVYQPGNDVQDNSVMINFVPNQVPYFTLESNGIALHTTPPGDSRYTEERGPLQGRSHEFLLKHSRLYGLFVIRYRNNQLVQGTTDIRRAGDESVTTNDLVLPTLSFEELYDQAFDLTMALIDQLRREVEADGAQFVVALASSDVQIKVGGNNERERAGLTDLGITHVDLLPAIRAAHSEASPTHFNCDGHWTEFGHQVVANELADFLRSNDLPN